MWAPTSDARRGRRARRRRRSARRGPRGSRDVKSGELRGVLRPLRRIRAEAPPARSTWRRRQAAHADAESSSRPTRAYACARKKSVSVRAVSSSGIDPRGGPSAAGASYASRAAWRKGRARSGSPRLHQRRPRALLVWMRARGARMRSPRGERGALARVRGRSRPRSSPRCRGRRRRDGARRTHERPPARGRPRRWCRERRRGGDRAMDSSRDSSAAAAAYRLLKGSDSGSAMAQRASTSAIVRGYRSATSARRVSAVALAAARSVAISSRGRGQPARAEVRDAGRAVTRRARRRRGASDDSCEPHSSA